ncbi:MAG: hydrogenase expression/formation C-terminal domain-containing protein [Ancalomicrobiaceae bacterium]|nr:hydrogenase expression/formation C-terminal domain-containing protein [Ancalomicrobiaceae bacterium]
MKTGFWAAPEDDAPLGLLPVAGPAFDVAPRRKVSFLATADADDMIARCPKVAALLPQLVAALEVQRAADPGKWFDLAGFTADERLVVDDVLGEGEVAATIALPNDVIAQVAESTMAGLWRVRFTGRDGAVIADYVEVAAVPEAARRAAGMVPGTLTIDTPPAGVMNVLPVLAEIRERAACYRHGDAGHTISLTLLPMSEADIGFLMRTLGAGPVRFVSKGYGSCRIQATAVKNVWSVQFFNSTDAILLDTIEIGGVPVVAEAAEDDFRDSAVRLKEIEEAYFA